jgi:dipeptidyl aminopeptidase/acylaminoacyl peptidase
MKKLFILFILNISFIVLLIAQTKKPLDHSVYAEWKSIRQPKISDDGKWVLYDITPARGDGYSCLVELAKSKQDTLFRAVAGNFSPNSNYATFKVTQYFDSIRLLKVAKKKNEELPKDTAVIYRFSDYSLKKYANIKDIKLAEEKSDWLVLHFEKEPKAKPIKNDSTKIDSTKIEDSLKIRKEGKEDSSKVKKEGTDIIILNPILEKEYKFTNVSDCNISKQGNFVYFTSIVKDSVDTCYVYLFDTKTEKTSELFKNTGAIKSFAFDTEGKQLAFLYSPDTSKRKIYNLFYWNDKTNKVQCVVDSLNNKIKKGYSISENYSPKFSDDATKLFFGVSEKPEPELPDTLLPEEKAVFDLWSWTDEVLQTQQLSEIKRARDKSLLYVYFSDTKSVVPLADSLVEEVTTINNGNSNIYLGRAFKYRMLVSWDGGYYDYYTVNPRTGAKKLIAEKYENGMLSPEGKYFIYYNYSDSSWYSLSTDKMIRVNLTKNIKTCFHNILHDQPSEPYAMGIAGFTEDSKEILIYGYYDIWVVDPTGKKEAYSLTNNYADKTNIQFRYYKLKKDEVYIDLNKSLLLKSFNTITRQDGFWLSVSKANPKLIVQGDYKINSLIKSENVDVQIYIKGSFENDPELYVSDIDFKNEKVLSLTNPQKANYYWGTVELVNWNSPQGKRMEGLLYKPENFDPNKKYPVLVYFYERTTQTLFQYMSPSPSRSVINIPYFISNGYIVFVPDIAYQVGYPGQSAFDDIVSGVLALTEKPYINKDKIGIQGQSWGGYQVVYLITRTNMFAAAGAGAPVSNMISAYGGIRWESGMSRMFQYEKSQSRIGATLWEKPLRFIENSPIFFADKVTTPLFMTHNDNDGAVPWYQGIEYFTALRRLRKPVWMVNYNNDSHNLRAESWGNRMDLSIRLAQFFNHYLKDEPMPKWMKEGIPAIKKGKEFGY